MITSFFKKYILPKDIDFVSALEKQSHIVNKITKDLYICFIEGNQDNCTAILNDEHKAKKMKEKNMKELLDTFITPVDRESIYRVITQLDWIALSIRHFVLEANAYNVHKLSSGYIDILKDIDTQASTLNIGFKNIKSSPKIVIKSAQEVRDGYDSLTSTYIQEMTKLSQSDNIKEVFIHRELLSQLKEISKRMQVCANSLEDIVIKMN